MQRPANEISHDHSPQLGGDRLSAVRGVVASAVERRARGELLPDQQLIDSHADLMPELGRELMLRRIVRRAYVAARKAGPAEPSATPLQPVGVDEMDCPIDAEAVAMADAGAGAADATDADPLPEIFGYQLQDPIGGGGQARVYRAVQESTGRRVAIKLLSGGAFAVSRDRSRFEREAKVLAALDHPGLVSILDRGRTSDGAFYLVMPYVDGCDLDEYLDAEAGEAPSCVADLLRLFAKIADAVGEAHRNGVVHRDLKPSNVRIDARGAPHVLDFGLARLLDDAPAPDEPVTAVTRAGQVVGSIPWFSPEQAAGVSGAADARSDVYALGVMLYDALTGRLPYELGRSWQETRDRIMKANPPPPSRVRGARYAPVPPVLDVVLLKALAKRPCDRYAAAAELARDLENVLGGRRTVARAVPRRRWRITSAGAVSACLVGGLILHFAVFRPPPPRDPSPPSDPPARSLPGPPARFNGPAGVQFVRLPAGSCLVPVPGKSSGSAGDTKFELTQIAHAFYLGEHQVTAAQFAKVMRLPPPAPADAHRPIQVTQPAAREFCQRLRAMDNRPYRVPSMGELEYARQAGASLANQAKLGPVDPMAPNAWGIYEMSGNTSEWFMESDGLRPPAPGIGPVNEIAGVFRPPSHGRTDEVRQGTLEEERHCFRVILFQDR